MKNQAIRILAVFIIVPLIFVACSKDDDENPDSQKLSQAVTGTYKGSIISSNDPANPHDAVITVTETDENTVHLNLVSDMLDTSFMLNLYVHGDSVMTCFTEGEFYEHYGHNLDEDHHMMGGDDNMNWEHHIDEQHEPGDEHYGGFNMNHHSFSYRIIPGGQNDTFYQFEGDKE